MLSNCRWRHRGWEARGRNFSAGDRSLSQHCAQGTPGARPCVRRPVSSRIVCWASGRPGDRLADVPATECGVRGARSRGTGVKAGAPGWRGRGGRTRGAAWDVTSGALCIVGIPGPRRLVPVHSAAEPGGGGERAARGREARRRAGGPARSAERKGASGREGTGRTPSCCRRRRRAAP